MKIIIVSDSNKDNQSIIPYGLHLAKHLEMETDIVHVIDTRDLQGVNSPYADSQSIAPGYKMSYEKIIEREKKNNYLKLDKIVSKEGSKLNYPLKINIQIKENSLREALASQKDDFLLLINSKPDDYVFNSRKEMYETAKEFKCRVMFVRPGNDFKPVQNALLVMDYGSLDEMEKLRSILDWLVRFQIKSLNVVDVVKQKDYAREEMKSKEWEVELERELPRLSIKTNIITGDDYFEALGTYIEKTKPDIVLPYKKKKGLLKSSINHKLFNYLLENNMEKVLL